MISGCRAAALRAKLPALAALLMFPTASHPQTMSTGPSYTVNSIVQAATQTAEALAPNTIATIYGTNLAYTTATVGGSNLVGGDLPYNLGGVTVVVNGLLCNLFFVSPTQINFLVPYQLLAGSTTLVVENQAIAGPVVPIQLNGTSPGMFLYNGFVVATHLNGTVVTPTSPANPGEIIVIYAVGLGKTSPPTTSGQIVTSAATISAASQMKVMLAGQPCPAGNILYAGLAPGFAGLYQVNLVVPPLTPPNPTIQIAIGTQISPPGVQLAVQ
jgi:uncharacterized protein (TIGR03437 family)